MLRIVNSQLFSSGDIPQRNPLIIYRCGIRITTVIPII